MPDSSIKYLHLIAHATLDHESRVEYIGAVQDVTQRRLAEEALANARSELDDNLPLISGDRVQLQQVILNLLRNASDAMSQNDDRPRELLMKTVLDGEGRVRLTVRDSGVGFDLHAMDRLF